MNKKPHEKLVDVHGLEQEIEEMEEQIERLYARASRVTTVIDGMPRAPGSVDPMAGTMARIDEAKRSLVAMTERHATAMAEHTRRVSVIRPIYGRLITLRYLEGHSWRAIAKKMGYSNSYIQSDLKPAALVAYDSVDISAQKF